MQRGLEAYKRRTGRDATAYFAVGDAAAIVERIAEYIAAGVSKFVLRPVGSGDEVLAQTRQLIEEVLPRVASRWPKPAKPPA
jgi:alkanesulfonate monooxygenase SsuD/methylene tetrahydromethanopterin reductase-like flavin-dependent oxidoreductase (luciferase family)